MCVIAVVGSGIAGDEAAFAARRTNERCRVVMITREPYPLYSACVLADYLGHEIPEENVFLRREEEYARAGIELLLSCEVRGWVPEQRILLLDGRELVYDQLILATGSQAVIPPVPGVEKEGVHTLKTFHDAEVLRTVQGRSAVVVGTGPVGIEAAVAFRKRGWSVILVELLDRVLPRLFDAPPAETLKSYLEAEGIGVRVNERVVEILGGRRVEAVRTDRDTISANVVLMVVGMRPASDMARKGGLALGASKGIRVDDRMRTSRPEVWACGDCVESVELLTGREGLHMLWNNARMQGRVAGTNAAGGTRRYPGSLDVTTVSFFGRVAMSAGRLASDLGDEEPRVLHRKGSDHELWLVLEGDRLAGVQCIGRTERVGGFVASMLKGRSIGTILKGRPESLGGRDLWAFRGLQRDLRRLLEGR